MWHHTGSRKKQHVTYRDLNMIGFEVGITCWWHRRKHLYYEEFSNHYPTKIIPNFNASFLCHPSEVLECVIVLDCLEKQ
jgi:hypothetical protein